MRIPASTRDEHGNKRCSTCKTWMPVASFASSSGKPDGLQPRCRACNAAIYQGRRELIRDKMREYRFGLSRPAFDAMFESQGQACAICRSTEPGFNFWSVDHDHACCPQAGVSCGQCIRGILCSQCNHGIGALRDDTDILRAAIAYLDCGANVQGTRHSRAAITRGAR